VALADARFTELLEQIAARTPAPGGGAATALAGALAAALLEMAAAYAASRPTADANIANVRDRATTLRQRLLELADEDLVAYRPVLDAFALPTSDPHRGASIEAAMSAAAEAPLKIATAAAETAELAATAATAPGNEHLLGDATAGSALAEAATTAAVRLVELNLARRPADRRLADAHDLRRRASEARALTLGLRA
jgi:formiminotetrahydrofolate cyclodeaminase